MADNFLEKQYDDYDRRKSERAAARNKQWQSRLRAYQEKIAHEKEAEAAHSRTDTTGTKPVNKE